MKRQVAGSGIRRPRRGALPALVLWAAVAWLAAEAAPAESGRFTLRGYGVGMFTAGEEFPTELPVAGDRSTFSLSDGSGIGLDLEVLLKPRIGLELMVFFGDVDSELRVENGGAVARETLAMGTETYTLGVNYHLEPRGRADLSFGVFGGFSYYDDVTFSLPALAVAETFRFDDDLGFGVKAAVEVPLGANERWRAGAALRYQSSILEGEIAGQDLDVNPLMLSLGVGYRFKGML